jgi:hypothetical protein
VSHVSMCCMRGKGGKSAAGGACVASARGGLRWYRGGMCAFVAFVAFVACVARVLLVEDGAGSLLPGRQEGE